MNSVLDVEIKDKIPLNYGIGVTGSHKDFDYILVYQQLKDANVCELDINSWTYIGSAGAEHFYGKIKLPRLYCKITKTNRNDDFHRVGSIILCSGTKVDDYIREIEITRPVTKEDLKPNKWGQLKFEYYDEGDPTDRYNSTEELVIATKKKFKKLFAKGWKLTMKEDKLQKDEDGEYWEYTYPVIAKS